MKSDDRRIPDWRIAELAEAAAAPIETIAERAGLRRDEIIPMGRGVAKIDFAPVLERLHRAPQGRYVDVTAITPTPLGEGKTTTTIGLVQGLARLGHRPIATLRQPSSGPTFNIKGSAVGGGRAQCIPRSTISVRFTGDLDAVTNAHNLALVALTARLHHERRYDDERLRQSGLRRLNIDPNRIEWRWAIDFAAQALRRVHLEINTPDGPLLIDSGFQITASSELMAILAVSRDWRELRARVGRVVLARDRDGREITADDLDVAGAMTAWLVDALRPNLVQTFEGQPVLIHAGPFANIAFGQSSVIADLIGVRLGDFLVTESGFGADVGYEKFWNLKCRLTGLQPDAVVIVATVRALKVHGGGPPVKPGQPLDDAYIRENLALVERGCENLLAHIEIVRKSGVQPVVALNHFESDTSAEIATVRRAVEAAGARFAVAHHHRLGGDGARELAEAVAEAARAPRSFRFLYAPELPLEQKLECIAREIYGADGVDYTEAARDKVRSLAADPAASRYGVCVAKTHLSLSHEPGWKGRPRGWVLPVRDVLVYRGAEWIVPLAGPVQLMPGTGSNPAFRRIDIDVETGHITGLA